MLKKEIKRTFSRDFQMIQQENIQLTPVIGPILPPKPGQNKLNQSKTPTQIIQSLSQPQSNPILNFLSGSLLERQ